MLSLEQQLIQANLELASAQSQLEIEQLMVNRLKRDKQYDANETFGSKPKPVERDASFLKMFNFSYQKEPSGKKEELQHINSVASLNDSIDYANYLLEVQESKASVLKELQR